MMYVMTGDKGLIASSLKKRLEKQGSKCILGMDLREGKDICKDLKSKKCEADMMFHLAAQCKINKCISDPDWAFENVMGIHQSLEFCRKNNIKKIVAFSSSRVLSPERNTYTASKIYLEELCKAYYNCYGIKYIIIRPSTVYGPFDDKTHRLVDLWIRAALRGNDLKIYGDPKTKTLDFTFIDDFVDGVILTLKNKKWNEEYNLSGGEEYNLNKLAKFIIKETGNKSRHILNSQRSSKIKIMPIEKQQPQQVNVDISKMKDIGYKPKVTLEEGIKKTIKFYIDEKLK